MKLKGRYIEEISPEDQPEFSEGDFLGGNFDYEITGIDYYDENFNNVCEGIQEGAFVDIHAGAIQFLALVERHEPGIETPRS